MPSLYRIFEGLIKKRASPFRTYPWHITVILIESGGVGCIADIEWGVLPPTGGVHPVFYVGCIFVFRVHFGVQIEGEHQSHRAYFDNVILPDDNSLYFNSSEHNSSFDSSFRVDL